MPILGSVVAGVVAFQMINKRLKNGKKPTHEVTFNGQLQVRQNIPGRLRVLAPYLKHREHGHALVTQLSRIAGIHQVGSDYRTGSMLILYDPVKIQDDLLIGALLRLMGIEVENSPQEMSAVMREVRIANRAANYALLDKTRGVMDVRTLLPLTFVGLALKGYLQTGSLGTPSPATLLYWAYNTMGLGGGQNH